MGLETSEPCLSNEKKIKDVRDKQTCKSAPSLAMGFSWCRSGSSSREPLPHFVPPAALPGAAQARVGPGHPASAASTAGRTQSTARPTLEEPVEGGLFPEPVCTKAALCSGGLDTVLLALALAARAAQPGRCSARHELQQLQALPTPFPCSQSDSSAATTRLVDLKPRPGSWPLQFLNNQAVEASSACSSVDVREHPTWTAAMSAGTMCSRRQLEQMWKQPGSGYSGGRGLSPCDTRVAVPPSRQASLVRTVTIPLGNVLAGPGQPEGAVTASQAAGHLNAAIVHTP